MTPRLNKSRTLRLARLLEADARKKDGVKFCLGSWAESKEGEPGLNCGTHACAMGVAVLSGEFRKDGLSAESIGYWGGGRSLRPLHRSHEGICAAMSLFGMNDYEAYYIFLPKSYPVITGAAAERTVARRLRALAEDRRKFAARCARA